jgi:hypothetical protein
MHHASPVPSIEKNQADFRAFPNVFCSNLTSQINKYLRTYLLVKNCMNSLFVLR